MNVLNDCWVNGGFVVRSIGKNFAFGDSKKAQQKHIRVDKRHYNYIHVKVMHPLKHCFDSLLDSPPLVSSTRTKNRKNESNDERTNDRQTEWGRQQTFDKH